MGPAATSVWPVRMVDRAAGQPEHIQLTPRQLLLDWATHPQFLPAKATTAVADFSANWPMPLAEVAEEPVLLVVLQPLMPRRPVVPVRVPAYPERPRHMPGAEVVVRSIPEPVVPVVPVVVVLAKLLLGATPERPAPGAVEVRLPALLVQADPVS